MSVTATFYESPEGHQLRVIVKNNDIVISDYRIEKEASKNFNIKVLLKLLAGFLSGTADAKMGEIFYQQTGLFGPYTITIGAGLGVGIINAASFIDADFECGDTKKEIAKSWLSYILSAQASVTATLLAAEFSDSLSNNLAHQVITHIFFDIATATATIGDTTYGVKGCWPAIRDYLARTPLYHQHDEQLRSCGIISQNIPIILSRIAIITFVVVACFTSVLATGGEVVDYLHEKGLPFGIVAPFTTTTSLIAGNILNFPEIFAHITWGIDTIGEIEHAIICLLTQRYPSKQQIGLSILCFLFAFAFGCAMYGMGLKHHSKYNWFIEDQQTFAFIAATVPALTITNQAPLIRTFWNTITAIPGECAKLIPYARQLLNTLGTKLKCTRAPNALPFHVQ